MGRASLSARAGLSGDVRTAKDPDAPDPVPSSLLLDPCGLLPELGIVAAGTAEREVGQAEREGPQQRATIRPAVSPTSLPRGAPVHGG